MKIKRLLGFPTPLSGLLTPSPGLLALYITSAFESDLDPHAGTPSNRCGKKEMLKSRVASDLLYCNGTFSSNSHISREFFSEFLESINKWRKQMPARQRKSDKPTIKRERAKSTSIRAPLIRPSSFSISLEESRKKWNSFRRSWWDCVSRAFMFYVPSLAM